MKNKVFLSALASLFVSGCVTPTMQTPPKQEAGKGAVVLYSSTLQPTSFLRYSVNSNNTGTIDGGKVQLLYVTPGQYTFNVKVPAIAEPLQQKVNVAAGKNYYLNVYSTTDKNRNAMRTTYHFDTVSEADAMKYLQGPKKFTGWGDLVTNTLNGKQFQ
jgi:hypothetical protein